MTLLSVSGGTLELPALVLCDRADGGHLVVSPARAVWDRTALSAAELTAFECLVAGSARAMLEVLPQLRDGCINYWDAGNWALNADAEPAGPKSGPRHRQMHVHLFGRSPAARHPDWQWGEAPRFPPFASRRDWASEFAPLTTDECLAIASRARAIMASTYGGV